MDVLEESLPFIAAILVAIALLFGLTTAITKFLKPPQQELNIDSSIQIKEQKRRMEDIRRRQEELMRNQKQRIRDMQRF